MYRCRQYGEKLKMPHFYCQQQTLEDAQSLR